MLDFQPYLKSRTYPPEIILEGGIISDPSDCWKSSLDGNRIRKLLNSGETL